METRNGKHGPVVMTCLDCFLSGDKLEVKTYDGNSIKPSNDVVETAYSLLKLGFGQYDLVGNNCEHFAIFCKTGKRHSRQIRSIVELMFPTPIMLPNPFFPFY